MLFDFWKQHVSEWYRRRREYAKKKKELRSDEIAFKQMQELEKVDPAAARRKKLEIQKEEEKKREAEERNQRL